jgi:hypothetical protein
MVESKLLAKQIAAGLGVKSVFRASWHARVSTVRSTGASRPELGTWHTAGSAVKHPGDGDGDGVGVLCSDIGVEIIDSEGLEATGVEESNDELGIDEIGVDDSDIKVEIIESGGVETIGVVEANDELNTDAMWDASNEDAIDVDVAKETVTGVDEVDDDGRTSDENELVPESKGVCELPRLACGWVFTESTEDVLDDNSVETDADPVESGYLGMGVVCSVSRGSSISTVPSCPGRLGVAIVIVVIVEPE